MPCDTRQNEQMGCRRLLESTRRSRRLAEPRESACYEHVRCSPSTRAPRTSATACPDRDVFGSTSAAVHRCWPAKTQIGPVPQLTTRKSRNLRASFHVDSGLLRDVMCLITGKSFPREFGNFRMTISPFTHFSSSLGLATRHRWPTLNVSRPWLGTFSPICLVRVPPQCIGRHVE